MVDERRQKLVLLNISQNLFVSLNLDLKYLTELNAGNNCLNDQNLDLTLPNIQKIYFGYNGFKNVPKCIKSFSKLQILNLQENLINKIDIKSDFPDSLEELDLTGNQLAYSKEDEYRKFLDDFEYLPKLRKLGLAKNPFVYERKLYKSQIFNKYPMLKTIDGLQKTADADRLMRQLDPEGCRGERSAISVKVVSKPK